MISIHIDTKIAIFWLLLLLLHGTRRTGHPPQQEQQHLTVTQFYSLPSPHMKSFDDKILWK
jgi:hypothetical protein